jgi:hypothetical protein
MRRGGTYLAQLEEGELEVQMFATKGHKERWGNVRVKWKKKECN